MKPLALSLLIYGLASTLSTADPPAPEGAIDFIRLVDSIYHAEGGSRTKFPYGIKTVRTHSRSHARQVCFATVFNTYERWDERGDFIHFLGRRYCPPSDDPIGHRNWIKNVTWYYNNPKPVKHE